MASTSALMSASMYRAWVIPSACRRILATTPGLAPVRSSIVARYLRQEWYVAARPR